MGEDTGADRHERILFRRDEIADLSAMPSASTGKAPAGRKGSRIKALRRRARRSLLRKLAIVGAVVLLIIGLAVAAGGFILTSGIGAERLRAEAEQALKRRLGRDVDVDVGAIRLSLLGPSFVNLSLAELDVRDPQLKASVLQAGALRFGIQLRPLLSGQLKFDSAELKAARIAGEALPAAGGGSLWTALLNRDGLVEPDLLLKSAFETVDGLVDSFGSGGAPTVRVDDIVLAVAPDLPIAIRHASLSEIDGRLALEGVGAFGGREVEFSAEANRPPGASQVDGFHLEFRSGAQPTPSSALALGDTLAAITGDRRGRGKPSIRLSMGARSFTLDLGKRGELAGSLNLAAVLVEGSAKIEIERLNADIGQSRYRMNGAIGPRPRTDSDGGALAYRYEFIGNDSVLAPQDTGEPAMPMNLRLAGLYRPDVHVLSVDEIAIATNSGLAMGKAGLTFDGLKPPGIELELGVHGLSVAHVKTLWPWLAAESARRWVNANIAGGTVPSGSLNLSTPPGRLGNGERLGAREVWGEFRIANARVHTAGDIPPIDQAIGEVRFAGDDVEIGLDSGRATIGEGPAIEASAGTLTIRDAGRPPVFGELKLKLAGPADAVARLASVNPINAMGRTGIEPDGLSGKVSGDVTATIPIGRNADRSRLDWKVDLAFEGLSLAKPIQGQTITAATGTLSVDRRAATIKADARLNGTPAKLDIVEPVGPDSPMRRARKVSLTLDQQGLDRLAPGLRNIVAGPVRAEVDASVAGRASVDADLTTATINVPGIGWTKGRGVPARASFDLTQAGRQAQLSNFRIDGASFGVSGVVNVAGGSLVSARFGNVELNRGDKFKVDIDRRDGGYSIVVSGDVLDGRGLIKQATSARQGRAERASGPPVALKARIGRLIGFNEEALKDVSFDVTASGRGDLSLEGKTGNGRPVSIATRRGDISIYSEDAGDLLRFLNIYPRVQGGKLRARLKARPDGSYAGTIDADGFWVVNEPKLNSLVSSAPQGGGSLNEAVKTQIDTRRARFERGRATVELGSDYLRFVDGVLRGPELGATFRGMAYDARNRMSLTGTFMPAYGLNSMFGEIPVLGALLGNGSDKGLIGVTYKLTGNARSPQLQINPLSVVAPGIFRSIFEFR